jgi:hypothetical protein
MWGVLLIMLGGTIVGAFLAWSNSTLIGIFGTTLLLFVFMQIAYQILVRRVGFEVNRYRCSRCRYFWLVQDLTPQRTALVVRKLEEDLPHLRQRGQERAIADTLVALGSAKLSLEDQEQGVRLSQEGLALARQIEHQRAVAIALNSLGLAALLLGDHERARDLLEECRSEARTLGEWQWIAMPLNNLGFATLDGGEDRQAERLFAESLDLQRKLGQRVFIAWGLAGLAEVGIVRHRMGHAARLCAAAQAVCEDAGVPFLEGMRRRQERAITAARAVLGETAFAAAWAEGRMMPQNKAIDYALSAIHQNEV